MSARALQGAARSVVQLCSRPGAVRRPLSTRPPTTSTAAGLAKNKPRYAPPPPQPPRQGGGLLVPAVGGLTVLYGAGLAYSMQDDQFRTRFETVAPFSSTILELLKPKAAATTPNPAPVDPAEPKFKPKKKKKKTIEEPKDEGAAAAAPAPAAAVPTEPTEPEPLTSTTDTGLTEASPPASPEAAANTVADTVASGSEPDAVPELKEQVSTTVSESTQDDTTQAGAAAAAASDAVESVASDVADASAEVADDVSAAVSKDVVEPIREVADDVAAKADAPVSADVISKSESAASADAAAEDTDGSAEAANDAIGGASADDTASEAADDATGGASADDAASDSTADASSSQTGDDGAVAPAGNAPDDGDDKVYVEPGLTTELTDPTDVNDSAEAEAEAEHPVDRATAQKLADAEARITQLEAFLVQRDEQLEQNYEAQRRILRIHLEEETTRLRAQYEKTLQGYKQRLENKNQENAKKVAAEERARCEEEMRAKLNTQAQEIWADSEAELKLRVGRERAARVTEVEKLVVKVRAMEAVMKKYQGAQQRIEHTHHLLVATEALESEAVGHDGIQVQLDALKRASQQDDFIRLLVAAVPEPVMQQGVKSLQELRSRFDDVRPAVQQVAWVKESSGFWSHLFSAGLAAITVTRKGDVSGDDVSSVLARADHFLTNGDIDMATREMNALKGQPRSVAESWIEDARNHLEAKQAIEAARAYVATLSLSLFG